MERKIIDEKFIILLKYVYIAIIVYFICIDNKITTYKIVFLLLYIINNQLRFFLLNNKKRKNYISYILEFLIACRIYEFSPGFPYLIFMPTLIDIAITSSNITLIIYIIVMGIFTVMVKHSIMAVIISSLPIIALGIMVRDEFKEKVKAQQLYDKLREREEELKKVNEELQNYANTIEEVAILRERNRISREIHDNVGHALSTIMIQLGAIERIAPINGKGAAEMASNLGRFTDDSLKSVRSAVRSMKPREFEEYEGIIAVSEMIKNFEKLSGIKVILKFSEKLWSLNADQNMVIYRIIQEFLSNSIRHGKATEVRILLNFLENNLRIHIKDNGIGCSNIIEGVGLKSIKERVSVWGGTMECYSKIGEGFEIISTIEKGKLSVDGV